MTHPGPSWGTQVSAAYELLEVPKPAALDEVVRVIKRQDNCVSRLGSSLLPIEERQSR
jgi:hypothetical protein